MPRTSATKKTKVEPAGEPLLVPATEVSNSKKPVDAIKSFETKLKAQLADLHASVEQITGEIVMQLGASQSLITDQQKTAAQIAEATQQHQQQVLKEQARQQEEFAYEFERKKRRLEAELNEKAAAAEKRWGEREAVLSQAEQELTDLRNLAKTFEIRTEKSVGEAVAAKVKELQDKHQQALALLTQETRNKNQLAQQKIESLEQLIKSQQQEIARLIKQTETISEQMIKIAQSAVTKPPVYPEPKSSQV